MIISNIIATNLMMKPNSIMYVAPAIMFMMPVIFEYSTFLSSLSNDIPKIIVYVP